MASKLIAPQRLYRTAAGDLCEENDPRVAYVLVNVGHEVPADYVDKVVAYLAVAEAVEPEPDAETASADGGAPADAAAAQAEADAAAAAADAETKQAAKPADKQTKAAENK